MPVLLAACAVTAVIGCNELVRPHLSVVGVAPSFEVAAAAPEQGCARFDIRLHGRDSITVDSVTAAPAGSEGCGTIRPIIVGKPTYDRARRLIGLPVALENAGPRALRSPARLYGWEDSVVITAPPVLVDNEYAGYVDFARADSSISTASSRFGGSLLWRFDTLLAVSGESQVLAAGARSRLRWIELTVMPGVRELRTTLWGEAGRAGTQVPPVAPGGVAADVWAALTVPQNIFSERAGGPRFVRNAVWVVFQASATQADRQAAIDLVSGDVIGGSRLGQPPYGGTYLVRLPGVTVTAPDSALGPMLQARARLRELPTVKYVWPVILDPPGPAF
jgi:hypothetical protein